MKDKEIEKLWEFFKEKYLEEDKFRFRARGPSDFFPFCIGYAVGKGDNDTFKIEKKN